MHYYTHSERMSHVMTCCSKDLSKHKLSLHNLTVLSQATVLISSISPIDNSKLLKEKHNLSFVYTMHSVHLQQQ